MKNLKRFDQKLARTTLIISVLVVLAAIPVGYYLFAKNQTIKSTADTFPNTVQAFEKTIKFNAVVSKGEKFEKEIGNNLVFLLIPQKLGWTISIGNKTNSENNFAQVVTPPYRGMNTIYVEGWHFRNSDNSGPNEAGIKNVNAPGEIREFNFVLHDTDYQKALNALDKMVRQYSYSEQEIDRASALHENLSRGQGTLMIRELTLNKLIARKQAGIDSMKFDVVLTLP